MFNLTIMNLRRFLAIAVLSLLSFQGYASHLLGGEIVWKCKPNGKYQFTLVVYRDCGGISLPTSAQSLATNAGVSISCAYISTTDVVPSCYTGVNLSLALERYPDINFTATREQ